MSVASLPKHDISLKQIDMNDSPIGGFNSSNQNFKEIERLLNIFSTKITELSGDIDVEAITSKTIDVIESSKKMFPLHYGLSETSEPEQFTYYDKIYIVTRVDDKTFKITRYLGLDQKEWDTSRIIAQVKDNDGTVANVMITTRESAIVIRFQDIPETDNFLFII